MSKVLKHSHGCACPVASAMFDSLRPFRLQPTRFLCPWAFSRQEYWSGLQWPPPGGLPNQRIESGSLSSPPLAGGFFAHWATWEAQAFTTHTHTHTHTHTPDTLGSSSDPESWSPYSTKSFKHWFILVFLFWNEIYILCTTLRFGLWYTSINWNNKLNTFYFSYNWMERWLLSSGRRY